jgi:hypothetical protein
MNISVDSIGAVRRSCAPAAPTNAAHAINVTHALISGFMVFLHPRAMRGRNEPLLLGRPRRRARRATTVEFSDESKVSIGMRPNEARARRGTSSRTMCASVNGTAL